MSNGYYRPCAELDLCNGLIEKYFNTRQYEKCFEGHLPLAEQGYPLAECQIGYFYFDGLGAEKDLEKALYWTRRAAHHGDRDGQYNLAWFCEEGIGMEKDMEQAVFWYRRAANQNHDLAVRKCRELNIDIHPSSPERESRRKDLKCRVYPLNSLIDYKYTVICTAYQGKWLMSRHKKRTTWETQGGHIEPGETPLEAAKRELWEESGAEEYTIEPIFDYWATDDIGSSTGAVFRAEITKLGPIPKGSEMAEVRLFDTLPDVFTYTYISTVLFAEEKKLEK